MPDRKDSKERLMQLLGLSRFGGSAAGPNTTDDIMRRLEAIGVQFPTGMSGQPMGHSGIGGIPQAPRMRTTAPTTPVLPTQRRGSIPMGHSGIGGIDSNPPRPPRRGLIDSLLSQRDRRG